MVEPDRFAVLWWTGAHGRADELGDGCRRRSAQASRRLLRRGMRRQCPAPARLPSTARAIKTAYFDFGNVAVQLTGCCELSGQAWNGGQIGGQVTVRSQFLRRCCTVVGLRVTPHIMVTWPIPALASRTSTSRAPCAHFSK